MDKIVKDEEDGKRIEELTQELDELKEELAQKITQVTQLESDKQSLEATFNEEKVVLEKSIEQLTAELTDTKAKAEKDQNESNQKLTSFE